MREDHDTYCDRCGQTIDVCAEPSCRMRYNHGGGLCPTCAEIELGKSWEEQ